MAWLGPIGFTGVLLAGVLLAGCGGSSSSRQDGVRAGQESSPPAKAPSPSPPDTAAPRAEAAAPLPVEAPSPPADLRVVFGEGGGFTGRWQGRTILADGSWQRWEGQAAEQNAEMAGTIPAGNLRSLWAEIERIGFFDLEKGTPANLTRFVRVTAGGRTHEVMWAPQLGETAPARPVETLYETCRILTEPGAGR